MFDIYNNKEAFAYQKPPKIIFRLFLFLILAFLALIYFLTKTKVYNNYQTKGYVTCEEKCYLTTFLPSNIPPEKITFNNKDLPFTILESTIELDENSMISYQKLTIANEAFKKDKEIVNLNFYYDKQRIIKHIIEKNF